MKYTIMKRSPDHMLYVGSEYQEYLYEGTSLIKGDILTSVSISI